MTTPLVITIPYAPSPAEQKSADLLVGFARGILSDGMLVDQEIADLRRWLATTEAAALGWPFDDLARRLDSIYADGVVDPTERAELRAMLATLGAELHSPPTKNTPPTVEITSATLPLDNPPPALVFSGAAFCVTGKFAFGTRAKVHAAITGLGGVASDRVTTDTNYLVIGAFASSEWAHTSYGRKIERAVELRREGTGIVIIGENHWRQALNP